MNNWLKGFFNIFLLWLKNVLVTSSKFCGFLILKYFSLGEKNNKVLSTFGFGEKDNDLAKNLEVNFGEQLTVINNDILNINENLLFDERVTVFGNLPYNISTEILSKWIINLKDNFWFDHLVLMFQKEVAERIISTSNSSTYGRLSILANWKLDIKKICDIKPESFSPRPKIDSSLLFFTPKKNFYKISDPKNLEKVTRIFFSQRRKMLKKPFNQLFNGEQKIISKLKIDLNLRQQNLDFDTYYKLTSEYEKLRS